VQRAVKFAKYLPEHGWDVSVLTTSNPSVPVLDPSMLSDVPPATIVRRARTLEPAYAVKSFVTSGSATVKRQNTFGQIIKGAARWCAKTLLQPDPQILWMPGAVRAGRQLLADAPHDAVMVTGPPFSAFLIGRRLARETGLPLVLDYRDEWSLSNLVWENRRIGRVSALLQRRMQEKVLRSADALIATTGASAEALEDISKPSASGAVVSTVYNGFDPDDFPTTQNESTTQVDPPRRHSKYRLAYVGTLWNLTSIEPLVQAIHELCRSDPELGERLELVLAGRRTSEQDERLLALEGLPCQVSCRPYVEHQEAVEIMRAADGLCLLLSDVESAGRVVPAKLFEYMAARRWILSVTPRGEVWDLLRDHPAAECREPKDIEGIADVLASEIRRHVDGIRGHHFDDDFRQYDRRNQARQLATLLDGLQSDEIAVAEIDADGSPIESDAEAAFAHQVH